MHIHERIGNPVDSGDREARSVRNRKGQDGTWLPRGNVRAHHCGQANPSPDAAGAALVFTVTNLFFPAWVKVGYAGDYEAVVLGKAVDVVVEGAWICA